MINDLLKYYKKKVSPYGLIFIHLKLTYFSALIVFSLFLLSIIPLMFSIFRSFFIPTSITSSLVSMGLLLVILILLMNLVNKRAINTLHKKYNIKQTTKNWRNTSFEMLQNQNLIDYLTKTELYKIDKLKLLIEFINKDIERAKMPSIIAPGILLTLFIPIWIQYISKLFISADENESLSLLISISSLLILVIIFYSIAKWLIKELFEIISFSDSMYKKGLVEKLNELLITYPADEITK